MIKHLLLILIPAVFLISCRKNTSANAIAAPDELVYKDVRGMVYNICTDSGLAGIPVYLYVFRGDKKEKILKTVSDSEGNYVFNQAELHTSKDYNYNIYIHSVPGTLPKDSNTCGFTGSSLTLNLEDLNNPIRSKVVPFFIRITFYYLRENVSSNSDSVMTRFYQNIYHKNRPDYPYSFGEKSTGSQKNFYSGINTYPMGKYNILVDKWIGGVHTQIKDSIYTKYADTAAYVVHW